MSFSLNVRPEPPRPAIRAPRRRVPPVVLASVLGFAALLAYDAAFMGGRQRERLAEAAERALELVRVRLDRIWRG